MRKLLFFIVLIVLALALVVPFFLPLEGLRNQLANSLSQRLQHKVVIAKLEANLFPPGVKLHDVSLLNPAGDSPLLQVQQVIAPVSVAALFQGKIVPQSINVSGWLAYVRRKPDGLWAWDEWLVPTVHLGENAGWPIQKIIFDRGECHAIDPYGPGPEEFIIQVLQGSWASDRKYVSIDGVLTSLPSPVSFQFQGSGRFLGDAQWTGVFGLTDENRQWKLECKMNPGHLEADGQSLEWRFDTAYAFLRYYSRLPVPAPVASPNTVLQGWKNHFDWQGGTLSFSQSAGVAGGHAEATGSILFHQPLSTAKVDLALQGAKIQYLESALWGSAPFEGTATGLAHFDLALSSSSWSRINGQGALELKDGRYFWPDVSIKSLAKAHSMKYLQKKFPGFQQAGLGYSLGTFHWQARQGVFLFSDAYFNLGDIRLALAGKYDAARHGLDAYTRVQVHETHPELMKELPPSYVYKAEGVTQIQPMYGQLQGTPAEWHLRAVRPSRIPPDTAHKLSQTLRSH